MTFKQISENLVQAFGGNNRTFAELERCEDGRFLCFFQIFDGSALTSANLREIADKLDNLNKQ